MRSLLELLRKEKELVDQLESLDHSAVMYMRDLDHVKEYPYECDSKQSEIKRLEDSLTELSNKANACKKNIEHARGAIREYMQVLMNGETTASDA